MDGGSAENAGAVFCQNCLEQFWTPARRSAGRPTGMWVANPPTKLPQYWPFLISYHLRNDPKQSEFTTTMMAKMQNRFPAKIPKAILGTLQGGPQEYVSQIPHSGCTVFTPPLFVLKLRCKNPRWPKLLYFYSDPLIMMTNVDILEYVMESKQSLARESKQDRA